MSGKKCFVQGCHTNERSNPDKYLFSVPYKKGMRTAWCKAVGRTSPLNDNSTVHCCSDHFNFERDIDPWQSSRVNPILRKSAIPSLEQQKRFQIIDIEIANRPEVESNMHVEEIVFLQENGGAPRIERHHRLHGSGNHLKRVKFVPLPDPEESTSNQTLCREPDLQQKRQNELPESITEANVKRIRLPSGDDDDGDDNDNEMEKKL